MNLLVKARPEGRVITDVTPASAGWTHVGFRALRLSAGGEDRATEQGARGRAGQPDTRAKLEQKLWSGVIKAANIRLD